MSEPAKPNYLSNLVLSFELRKALLPQLDRLVSFDYASDTPIHKETSSSSVHVSVTTLLLVLALAQVILLPGATEPIHNAFRILTVISNAISLVAPGVLAPVLFTASVVQLLY